MPGFRLNTPVVLLIFNRPEATAEVFAAVRNARPPQLVVVADGPRTNIESDPKACAEARAVVGQVDWDCEVITDFSATNMGLKRRVSSGLARAFELTDCAIILEDDCLPHDSFFRFSEELLERYRYDTRVMAISGNNFQGGRNSTDYSYYFSRYFHCWGWATWRRSFVNFDPGVKLWPEVRDGNWLADVSGAQGDLSYWSDVFQALHEGKIDSWAYAWTFASFIQRGLTILPSTNLVTNLGFGEMATHTKDQDSELAVPSAPMSFPLSHPPFVLTHAAADEWTRASQFSRKSTLSRIMKKLRRTMSDRSDIV